MPQTDNLIHELTTTPGTGPFTLEPIEGKRRFSDNPEWIAAGGARSFWYFALSRAVVSPWEFGLGLLGTGGELQRTPVRSSNTNSLVDFGGNEVDVTSDIPAWLDIGAASQAEFLAQIQHTYGDNPPQDANILDMWTEQASQITYRLVRDSLNQGGTRAWVRVDGTRQALPR